MSRDQDRLEMLASDLASRYGELDEVVRNVRMSIGAKEDIPAPKPLPAGSVPIKPERRSATPGSHGSALLRRL